MVPGLTVAAAVGVCTVPAVGVLSVTVAVRVRLGGRLRARSTGARDSGGARGGGGGGTGACRHRQQQRGTECYGTVGAERSRTSLGRSLGSVILCRVHSDLSASSVRVPNQYSKDTTCELAIRYLRNPQDDPSRVQREKAIRGAPRYCGEPLLASHKSMTAHCL